MGKAWRAKGRVRTRIARTCCRVPIWIIPKSHLIGWGGKAPSADCLAPRTLAFEPSANASRGARLAGRRCAPRCNRASAELLRRSLAPAARLCSLRREIFLQTNDAADDPSTSRSCSVCFRIEKPRTARHTSRPLSLLGDHRAFKRLADSQISADTEEQQRNCPILHIYI